MAKARIYLVPGFFGFANLGELRYFGHVHRALSARPGVEVHEVPTRPTASLKRRAVRLLDAILATADPSDELHLVGHSSGGLDARLLVSPAVALDRSDVEAVAARVRSVVTVATPHRGTPSAAFFSTVAGKQALRLVSLLTIVTLRRGRVPLEAVVAVGRLLRRVESHLDDQRGILDELFGSLLGDLTPERQEAVRAFFADVADDQALLPQITPDGLEVFNATVPNRPSVRYGSIVTRGRRPGLSGVLDAGASPNAQASHALYAACHRLAGWRRDADLAPAHRAALVTAWPDLTEPDNDGIVPTQSQPWGEVIGTADADHLDVIGHFSGADLAPPHYDWIRTGTGFGRQAFDAVWRDVGAFHGG